MDRVRFGRVLGTGARLAARTVVQAVDAAAAPNPNPSATPPTPPRPAAPPSPEAPSPQPSAQARGRAAAQVLAAKRRGVAVGSKRFGQAVWGPLTHLSGTLWLEFTGTFFALFAVFAALGIWKARAAFHPGATAAPEAQHRLWFAVAMFLVFSWFTVSSFVRAGRRSRASR